MGRAPCCEKNGLKKGPWTGEEDQILINHIKLHGHGKWRELPKLAGLLRCGKSCRLRWINYLRPDIKRGNFTREEEDTIIKLHGILGNKWSAIAASLPGRTDNEIKNIWHTHLKKRQKDQTVNHQNNKHNNGYDDVTVTDRDHHRDDDHDDDDDAPTQECTTTTTTSSDTSSVTSPTDKATNTCVKKEPTSSDGEFVEIDENFWTEVLSADNSSTAVDADQQQQKNDYNNINNDFPSTTAAVHDLLGFGFGSSSGCDVSDNTSFWYNLFH